MILRLVTFVLVFHTFMIHAQDASSSKARKNHPLTIKYDFAKDSRTPKKIYWVREGAGAEFVIKNINLFNYNVNINNSREDYINDTNNASKPNEYNNLLSVQEFNTQFLQEINKINSLERILASASKGNFFDQRYTKDATNSESFKNAVDLRSDKLKSNIESLAATKAVDTEWLHQAVLYYKDLFILLQSEDSIEELLEKRKAITDHMYKKALEANGENFRFCIAFNQIISLRQRVITEVTRKMKGAQNIATDLKTIEYLHNQEKEKDDIIPAYQASLDLIETTAAELESSYKSVSEILSSAKIDDFANEVQKLYMSFETSNHEIHIKEYDLENVDLVKLDVTIEPKSTSLAYRSRKEQFTTTIRTYNGIRFDASAGLMFNFGLNDRSYYYDSSIFLSDTATIVAERDRNSYLPFIGSQLNIYLNKPWRFPLSPGFTLGVSTNLTDIRYYLGGCLVLGNKDRIVLSGGVVGGEINLLSGRFDSGRSYPREQLPEIPEVVRAFRVGTYFSITYNLSSNKAKTFGDQITSRK